MPPCHESEAQCWLTWTPIPRPIVAHIHCIIQFGGWGRAGGGGDRGVRTSHLQYLCLPTPATFWRCSRKNSETRDRDPVVLRLFPLRSPSPLFLAFLSFSEHLSTPPLLMTQRSHICHPPKKDVVLFILWLNVALENRVYSVIKTSATVLQYKNETEVLRFLFSV